MRRAAVLLSLFTVIFAAPYAPAQRKPRKSPATQVKPVTVERVPAPYNRETDPEKIEYLKSIAPLTGWEKVSDTGRSVIFIEPRSLRRPARGVVRCWTKEVPTFGAYKGGAWRAETVARDEPAADSSGLPAYELVLYEVNCAGARMRTLSRVEYDRSGEVISSGDSPSAWAHVIPSSVGEEIKTAVCKTPRR